MRFDRSASLQIRLKNTNGPGYNQRLSISDLRIAFNIKKTVTWGTNTASIRVYNLNPSRRAILKEWGDQYILNAGYNLGGGEQLLFIGNSTSLSHTFNLPEIVTNIQVADGEIQLNETIVNLSYNSEIPIRQIIRIIAEKMNVKAYIAETDNLVWENGFSWDGQAKYAIDKCVKALGLTASMQNGKLICIPKDKSRGNTPIVINADTGMIGVPERFSYKQKDLLTNQRISGWKVRTSLRPEINPGDRVQIQSSRIDLKGLFKVLSANHQGDTHGLPWYSEFEVILL